MNQRIALLLVLLFAAPPRAQPRPAPSSSGAPKADPRGMLRALEDAFAAVADRATPAVVHVSTVPKRGPAGGPEDP